MMPATRILLLSVAVAAPACSSDSTAEMLAPGAETSTPSAAATDPSTDTGSTTSPAAGQPSEAPPRGVALTQPAAEVPLTPAAPTADASAALPPGPPLPVSDSGSTAADVPPEDGPLADSSPQDEPAELLPAAPAETPAAPEPGDLPGEVEPSEPAEAGEEPVAVPELTAVGSPGEVLAFPGAEGFGRNTTGGRGGEVVHVTNLNDSGPGSLRDAVSQSNRIVVFDVGGVINITDRIVVHQNVTVAGQTAPGGGITIYKNGIAFNGDSGNNIIRYIRIRMGQSGESKKDAVAISEGQNYMFDHVSISWGRDGTLDVNGDGIDNLTFQETIVAQGINSDNHSTGGLMQSGKWSVIRSLYVDNKTRNPKARGTHEFINSVLYNWASDGYIMGDTSGVSECNLVGNYFIYGPASSSGSHITNTTPTFYVYGDDNWVDSNKNGTLDGSVMTDYKTATLVDSPFDYPAGVTNKLSGPDALNYVLANVGASLVRDAVDEFLIDQVRSYGTEGQIINTEDDNGIPGNVGQVASGTPPTDSDRDGMPDAWESTRGLDPNSPDDSGDDDGDGYTNIEEYLSCIVGEGDCG